MAILHVRCLRIVRFLTCDVKNAVLSGLINHEMFYYFVCLLLKVRLSCKSLPEFFPSFFDFLSHSRSSISVCPTIATTVNQTLNKNVN